MQSRGYGGCYVELKPSILSDWLERVRSAKGDPWWTKYPHSLVIFHMPYSRQSFDNSRKRSEARINCLLKLGDLLLDIARLVLTMRLCIRRLLNTADIGNSSGPTGVHERRCDKAKGSCGSSTYCVLQYNRSGLT